MSGVYLLISLKMLSTTSAVEASSWVLLTCCTVSSVISPLRVSRAASELRSTLFTRPARMLVMVEELVLLMVLLEPLTRPAASVLSFSVLQMQLTSRWPLTRTAAPLLLLLSIT